ncbi:catalase-like [Haemaphysalis longicornis]
MQLANTRPGDEPTRGYVTFMLRAVAACLVLSFGFATAATSSDPLCSDDSSCHERNASSRDWASDQLKDYAKKHKGPKQLTTSWGAPIGDKSNVLTVGPRGPVLLQDFVFLDEMAHFDRERISERVAHAKGAGAFGYFQVTHDITNYTRASLFDHVGKKTPVAVRFSQAVGESGSADTARGPLGFAIKFYTDQGNWDLVGLNLPVFFMRDPFLFPSFIHSQNRNPVTHLKDADMYWDFLSLRAESTHAVMHVFSDRGIPDGYRHMDGFGCHTFKLVHADGTTVYCKFHIKNDQGSRSLSASEAEGLMGKDPDYYIRDLYNSIASKDYPTWTLYIQVMTFEQARSWTFNPFDVTKLWPLSEFPLIPVGKLVLQRNPTNYFSDVEQIAMTPANLVPGIEPSPDKLLQGRLFSYGDSQRHRLGPNFNQLPVNCPLKVRLANYERDGNMAVTNQGGAPNYFPNSFSGPVDDAKWNAPRFASPGDVDRWNSSSEDNFTQPREFWEALSDEERDHLTTNIANHLKDAQDFIRKRAVANFASAHPDFGAAVSKKLDELLQEL